MTCPICHGDMWDNRGKKTNPKAPDFKCKDQNCKGIIWPPKDMTPRPVAEYDAEQAPKQQNVPPLRDLDAENRGKIRSLFIQAHIQRAGIVSLTAKEEETLHNLVEIAMVGKAPAVVQDETLTDKQISEFADLV